MKKIVLCSALALLISSPALAEQKTEYDFAGVKSCKKCHRKVWKSWKVTPMAESFEILKPGERAEIKSKAGLDPNKDYTKDESCLPCHTTGYGKAGGFVSVEKTPTMVGVSCIHIIHSIINGISNHFNSFCFINCCLINHRKSHGTKSQRRCLPVSVDPIFRPRRSCKMISTSKSCWLSLLFASKGTFWRPPRSRCCKYRIYGVWDLTYCQE